MNFELCEGCGTPLEGTPPHCDFCPMDTADDELRLLLARRHGQRGREIVAQAGDDDGFLPADRMFASLLALQAFAFEQGLDFQATVNRVERHVAKAKERKGLTLEDVERETEAESGMLLDLDIMDEGVRPPTEKN